ncbi:hypothetical protein [Naasia lichenicola]|uniref:Response receiver domain-containing protein n=1 Tax=Naasia lichenicola TaxID=2565933 RepID=A0A4S4FHL7_9MICO|nr:hypothetical protein [Naasia lichenicola]THG29284.1 hypothetical protein E6C64_11195 [Naasia lichenicola]
MSILEGSVVFVDDDYDLGGHAKAFYDALKAQGRPIAAYDNVPPLEHLEHWDGLALVVLDWKLNDHEAGLGELSIPDSVKESTEAALIRFIMKLLDTYFCPVFIVSQEEPDAIQRALRETPDFPVQTIGRRVQVLQKDDGDLLPRLERLVEESPVLSTLRTWEGQYQSAKNKMFTDLDAAGDDWLIYLTEIAEDGGTNVGDELVDALYGNLRHRVNPREFDLASIEGKKLAVDSASRREVIHRRMVLATEALHSFTVMPGDFFGPWDPQQDAETVWLNLTPACDTVIGRLKNNKIRMYLLRGKPEDVAADDSRKLREGRLLTPNSAWIDVLHNGRGYRFPFKTLEIVTLDKILDYRLGRLLPPYITDVQQRHAMYLMREGLPAVLPTLYQAAIPAPGAS